jgi:uncharacterized membrane protein YqaE (UPF0057 family)
MLALVALVCPPLAVLAAGRSSQVVVSLVLTACLYVPGVVYALAVVDRHQTEKRNQALLRAVELHYA